MVMWKLAWDKGRHYFQGFHLHSSEDRLHCREFTCLLRPKKQIDIAEATSKMKL